MWAACAKAPDLKPQITADFPDAVIGECAEDLILRAEEAGSRRIIDTTHVEAERWDLRLSMRIGMHFVKPFTKESKDKNGKQGFAPGGGNYQA